MKFGLTQKQHNYITETVVIPLNQLGIKIYCYGSRAKGSHNKFSDLDLMIEANQNFPSEIAQIKELLTNSNFPFKVDIVELQDFADSYKDGYEQSKVLWH